MRAASLQAFLLVATEALTHTGCCITLCCLEEPSSGTNSIQFDKTSWLNRSISRSVTSHKLAMATGQPAGQDHHGSHCLVGAVL